MLRLFCLVTLAEQGEELGQMGCVIFFENITVILSLYNHLSLVLLGSCKYIDCCE